MANTTTKTTLIAQALADNNEFKKEHITPKTLGDYALAREWRNALKATRLPAYRIAEKRHNAMSKVEEESIDQSALYTALKPVLDLIGEINGHKLNAKNVAETIIGESHRIVVKDYNADLADARIDLRRAKIDEKNAETDADLETATAEKERLEDEIARLEAIPGNCKKQYDIRTETTFINAVEFLLGEAVTGQLAKSADEIAAEIKAKEDARKAKSKARRQAKRQAAAEARKAEAATTTEA